MMGFHLKRESRAFGRRGPVFLLILLMTFPAWAQNSSDVRSQAIQEYVKKPLDQEALRYLVLELAMGNIDPAHVDAYFGPQALQKAAEDAGWDADEIITRAETLNEELALAKLEFDDADSATRIKGLQERLRALITRAHMSQGTRYTFDEESRLLFGAVAPNLGPGHYQEIVDRIDRLLPGDGDLAVRVNDFKAGYEIPDDRLDAVFESAIKACRKKTKEKIDLPKGESFELEYVSDKPWTGYNWYQGSSHSLIQVNTDLPIHIDRAVSLGCHEGYPGHHVYNALIERDLVNGKGWIEYSLYPLFSPQSLIAEGSANYGIVMAFSQQERIAFEKQVLFPLAGLDASQADRYYHLEDLLRQLGFARNRAARGYLDGDMTAEQAKNWLMKYALNSPERAEKSLRFIDAYRSYVINYNLGMEIVRNWVEAGDADQDERWKRFIKLLSSNMTAADLVEH